jgi:type II secretory pathway pseudopilin PulG
MMVAVSIAAVIAMTAIPSLGRWNANQRVKAAARSLAGAFTLAQSEALRTGSLHIVFFQTDAQGNTLVDGDGNAVPILVLNDGRQGSANQNCRIDAGETIAVERAESDVAWGITGASAPAPSDFGGGDMTTGSSFIDPDGNAASWVLFRPEGVPVAFSPACVLGAVGSGPGAAYVTNGYRDYAVVVGPLGGIGVHGWDGASGSWSN